MYASNSTTYGISVEVQVVQQFACEKPRLMKMNMSFTVVYEADQLSIISLRISQK